MRRRPGRRWFTGVDENGTVVIGIEFDLDVMSSTSLQRRSARWRGDKREESTVVPNTPPTGQGRACRAEARHASARDRAPARGTRRSRRRRRHCRPPPTPPTSAVTRLKSPLLTEPPGRATAPQSVLERRAGAGTDPGRLPGTATALRVRKRRRDIVVAGGAGGRYSAFTEWGSIRACDVLRSRFSLRSNGRKKRRWSRSVLAVPRREAARPPCNRRRVSAAPRPDTARTGRGGGEPGQRTRHGRRRVSQLPGSGPLDYATEAPWLIASQCMTGLNQRSALARTKTRHRLRRVHPRLLVRR